MDERKRGGEWRVESGETDKQTDYQIDVRTCINNSFALASRQV
jgi:hypothetical protein